MTGKRTPDNLPGGLSIGDLAERTGVPPATLRSWEARYHALRPDRLAGGHRRYHERDVALVEEVGRRRAAGLSLPSAIKAALAQVDRPEASVFAALCRRHLELAPHVLRKGTMLALSRAIEDECCARAERPILMGCFQHPRFYESSKRRWVELARTADAAVVFADFPKAKAPKTSPLEVPLPADAPLLREWAVICDAPDYPACLVGWERPGQDSTPDPDRRFEALWSVDPRVVRHAARTCVQFMELTFPKVSQRLSETLAATPPAPSPDLRRAAGLLERMIDYLEHSGPSMHRRPGA